MDVIDKKILEILAKDAYATSTEIGQAINLSVPAVNKRILKMRETRVIKSFTVVTDPKAVGKPFTAYVLLAVKYGDSVDTLMEFVDRDPDVLECSAVTGEYDYIIKMCAQSVEAFEEKLLYMKKQKGVLKSHTMFCLLEHKFQPTVLPDREEK